MIGRRPRFREVIRRQLDAFEREHADVIAEAQARLDTYNDADREDAEELYGDYLDAVETGTEILADMRDHFARTLDDASEYVSAFNRVVRRRLPAYADAVERL